MQLELDLKNGKSDDIQLELTLENKKDCNNVESTRYILKETDDKSNFEELYDKYIWEKGSLIECKVIDIDDDYIYAIKSDECKNKYISIKMKKPFINTYKVDDILYAYISEVEIKNNYIEVLISNDSDNIARLLFNKLREKYGLNKCTIQKYIRKKGKSTCIVIVTFDDKEYKEEIEIISKEMKKHLNGEYVGIFIYDRKPEKFAANILGIDESYINIDKLSRKCIATVYIENEFRVRQLLEKQGSIIKNIYEYEIELKTIQDKTTQTVTKSDEEIKNVDTAKVDTFEHINDVLYKNLIGQKGKLIRGKIINIEEEQIQVDIGYNVDSSIKYFNKNILNKYKVGDYIEAVIDNLSKKEDSNVKVILSRDDVDFVKACLKEVRNNLGFKHITFKAAKRLPNKSEYIILANCGADNTINLEKQLLDIKAKVENKLYNEVLNIYEYNKDIIQQIKNITKINLTDINLDSEKSICNIICNKEEYEIVKSKQDSIQLIAGYKIVNVIEEIQKEANKDTTKNDSYNENYFINMFNRIKNELNIKYCNVKKCSYSDTYGVLLVIENKFKSNKREEIRFIESLMNEECNSNIVKIIEFKYDAYSFLCDLFNTDISNIQQVPGKFYIKNLDENNMDKYRFIRDQISKLVSYKIEI